MKNDCFRVVECFIKFAAVRDQTNLYSTVSYREHVIETVQRLAIVPLFEVA